MEHWSESSFPALCAHRKSKGFRLGKAVESRNGKKLTFTVRIEEGSFVQRIMLKSKIHRATLTATDLNYEGSITIDRTLLKAADILPGEQVHVLNLNNSSRLITYAIEGPEDSGVMLLNGPAAREGMVGDLIVVLTYANVDEKELDKYQPTVVRVDSQNRIIS